MYKRLAYTTISASATTVSIDHLQVRYLCTVWLVLQQETPKGISGRARFSTWDFNQLIWAAEPEQELPWRNVIENILETTFKNSATTTNTSLSRMWDLSQSHYLMFTVLSLQKNRWGSFSLPKELMTQGNWLCKRYISDTQLCSNYNT